MSAQIFGRNSTIQCPNAGLWTPVSHTASAMTSMPSNGSRMTSSSGVPVTMIEFDPKVHR